MKLNETHTHTGGRSPLNWLVVNPGGKLLAILDSESEAYWFTKNRGHAEGAIYFKAPIDYASAQELFESLHNLKTWVEADRLGYCAKELRDESLDRHLEIAAFAITKATGGKQ